MEQNAIKNKVDIQIQGIKYTILTEDSQDRVLKIASFVDQLVAQTKEYSPFMTNLSATVLACLNVGEELFRIKDELELLKVKQEEYTLLAEYKDKLVDALKEAEENEDKRKALQIKSERLELENEEMEDLIDEYKERFAEYRSELELNRKTINELQNKLLENQIELVKLRKSFLDYQE